MFIDPPTLHQQYSSHPSHHKTSQYKGKQRNCPKNPIVSMSICPPPTHTMKDLIPPIKNHSRNTKVIPMILKQSHSTKPLPQYKHFPKEQSKNSPTVPKKNKTQTNVQEIKATLSIAPMQHGSPKATPPICNGAPLPPPPSPPPLSLSTPPPSEPHKASA